jgi:hypothetical protein
VSGDLDVLDNGDENNRREQAGRAQIFRAGVFSPSIQIPVCERRKFGELMQLKETSDAG